MAVNYKSLAKVVGSKRAKDAKAKMESPETKARLSGGSSGSPYSASNPYTKPLSPQGQANVNAQVSSIQSPKNSGMSASQMQDWAKNAATNYLNRPRGVAGAFGTGPSDSGKIEFSVLPGSKTGPMPIQGGFNTANTTPTMQVGYVPQAGGNATTKGVDAFTKGMQFTGMVDQAGKLNPTGVALNMATAGLGGPILGFLGRGAKWGAGLIRGEKALTKVDDVARLTRPTNPYQVKVPPRGTRLPAPPVVPTALSRLGSLTKTTVKYGVGAGLVGTGIAGTVAVVGGLRNATTPTGAKPGTTPQGTTEGGAGSTDTQVAGRTAQTSLSPTSSYQTFSSPTSSYSTTSTSGSSVSGGSGSYGGISGGGNTGTAGSTALRGEQVTQQQAAAQARAIELQRQQASGAGVNIPPLGEQVDLAGLQELRNKAQQLYEQYGADAVTMPEYKAAIQGMIAAGVQNMRSIQPTPPEPVEETPEQAEATDALDEQSAFDVRAETDNFRRSIGLTGLESQKADLQRQMNSVNQVYEKVIDQIKENPNLPKGLAARRLTEVFEDQKFALSTILSELDIVQEQIDSGNTQVNQFMQQLGLQLQFDQAAQSREDKQYQRYMDQFGMMVESRAVGGMTDKEIRQWASVTGISEGAIQKLRSNALDSENEQTVSFERGANDELLMITYDKKNPMNKTVEQVGSMKMPSGGGSGATGGGGYSDLDLLANTVLGTGSVAKQERDFATYRQLVEQDPKKAEEWLYGKVATGLNATQKNDFRVFGSVVDGASGALAEIEKFASANPGVYASIFNKAAPYATLSRDQNYVSLMQKVTSIGNEYRNAIFGASLTGNEQTEGLKVVIGNNDDLPTIITKLQGLAGYSQEIRQRIILDAAGQIGTSLSDGGPGTIQGYASDIEDDEIFNSVTGAQSGGDTGYWSNLWGALTGFTSR
jgi:hypothetical protein